MLTPSLYYTIDGVILCLFWQFGVRSGPRRPTEKRRGGVSLIGRVARKSGEWRRRSGQWPVKRETGSRKPEKSAKQSQLESAINRLPSRS